MKWFRCISLNSPVVLEAKEAVGANGVFQLMCVLEEALKQEIFIIDLTHIKNWASVKHDRAIKLLPFAQEIINKTIEILGKSTQNLPEISENLPEISENLPEISENLPEISENLPEISENLPEIYSTSEDFTTPNPHGCRPLIEREEKKEKKREKINKKGCDRFDDFWDLYPKKVAKINSLKIWTRDKLDDKADQIISSVKNHLEAQEWLKDGGQFIPHPSTFLNQKRWEDEIYIPKQPQNTKDYGFGPNGYSPHGDVSGVKPVRRGVS